MVDFFIHRPVFATVCALLIILGGAVVIPTLPISLYPQLAPPQVTVSSNYIGANAQQVESAVTIPLEEAINGVPGMRYMQSTSANDGSSAITTTFNTGYNLDIAAVDVQNRVSSASGQLPATVNQTGITVTKANSNFVFGAGIYSPDGRYSNLFLSNYLDVYVKDAIQRVKGVGGVQIFGVGEYAMRIWLDPAKLAARDLTASDVITALQQQNIEVPAGQLGAPPSDSKQSFQISVNVVGRLTTPQEFDNVIVKNTPNGIVQIKDVGRAELGASSYASTLTFNGIPAVGFGVQQLSDANALQVDRDAKAELALLAKSFPPGIKYAVAFDTTTIVGASIHEVIKTLIEAIIIVIAVIFFFLQDWRATLIPAVTIPVALVGTFAFIRIFGFSINSLTLFGITLATGLVVDDAIVVIENVQRHISEGDRESHHTTSAAMREVTGDAEDDHLDLLVDLEHLAGVPDAAPGHVGDVQEAVDAAQVHERAEIGDVLDRSLADLVLRDVGQQLGLRLRAALLDQLAAADHDVAALLVDFEDLGLDLLADELPDVAGPADVHLAGRQKGRNADVHEQPALDRTRHHALDQVAFLVGGDDPLPAADAVGLALR